jgi:hypothetical protein
MPVRLCLGNPATGERCNVRVVDASYCPKHALEREHARAARRRAGGDIRQSMEWRYRIRPAVLERDGHRCTAVIDGERCPATTQLEVHHLDDDPTRNEPSNLVTVCRFHHPRKRKRKPWPPR